MVLKEVINLFKLIRADIRKIIDINNGGNQLETKSLKYKKRNMMILVMKKIIKKNIKLV